MKTFKHFVTESVQKNTHLEHLEDLVLKSGIEGAYTSLFFLRRILSSLAGSVETPIKLSVKWDGSPSIVCGREPTGGKFFVGTKAALSKTPKLCFSDADVDRIYSEMPELCKKLKLCLRHLSTIGITGILQGDLLFTRELIQKTVLNDEPHLVFKPNTIAYAVPVDSELANSIVSAELGIVFHTTYSGASMSSLRASYDVDLTALRRSSAVWIAAPEFLDCSGNATMTRGEVSDVNAKLTEIEEILTSTDASALRRLVHNPRISPRLQVFVNHKVLSGQTLSGSEADVTDFIEFVRSSLLVEVDALKTSWGKAARSQRDEETLRELAAEQSGLASLFRLMSKLSIAKQVLINKLASISALSTFLETPDGLVATSPEGFVAVDHIGNAIKLVDRLVFSRANFIQNNHI